MSQEFLLGAIALLLFVAGIPLIISISQRNREVRLAQPVIVFTTRSWQHKLLALLALLGALAGLAFIALGSVVLFSGFVALLADSTHTAVGMLLLMITGGLFVLMLGMIIASPALLYWNYWRNVGLASLTFRQAEQVLEYTSKNGSIQIPIGDIRQLSYRHTWQLRQNMGYTMLILANGQQLPVPTSLCNFDDLRALLPESEIEMISCWLPILPGNAATAYYQH